VKCADVFNQSGNVSPYQTVLAGMESILSPELRVRFT